MGNKIGGRRKQVVEEKYTRPQGLYQIKDVDFKKLRKLILDSKLAPCYPGADDSNPSLLEECPICFLYYPTLNRSRCCMKSICTECFLQMKNPNSTRPTQCPFCKTSNYAVEYRGGKSKEERGKEQIEEQKVIEAKIRMRQQELQEEEERQHRKDETNSANTDLRTENIICSTSEAVDSEETSLSQDTSGTQMLRQVQYNSRHGRDDEFDLDLEDIMVMEAIWLSIQENGRAGSSLSDNAMTEPYAVGDRDMSPVAAPMAVGSSSSPSGGLACAIAALAERQQLTGESSSNYNGLVTPLDMLPSSSRSSKRVKKTQRRPTDSSSAKEVSSLRTIEGCEVGPSSELIEVGTSYVNSYSGDEADVLPPPPPPLPPLMYHRWNHKRAKNRQKGCSFVRDSSKNLNDYNMVAGEWEFNHGSDEALSTTFVEAGTNFANFDESDDEFHQEPVLPPPPPPLLSSYDGNNTSNVCSEGNEDHGEYILPPQPPPPHPYVTDGGFQSSVPGPLVPESFEEQMMLAMAVSLAEARARTTAQGVAWH